MATLKEVDHAAVNGSATEPPTQEDAVGAQLYKTPERRHVDTLLDISEQDFLTELEPYEYHCYSGWEEAVQGWARVAPLSCILLTERKYRKPKHKEADNPTPVSIDPTIPITDSPVSIAENRCEPHVGPHNSSKKIMPLNQHPGSWSNTAEAALQTDALEWLVDGKREEEGTLRDTSLQPHNLSSKYSFVSDSRPTKPQKYSHRPSSTVVPIKNFTFLPPIISPHLNPQKVSGTKVPDGETIEENCFICDKKGRMRQTRVDPVSNAELRTYSAALTSKYRTCLHNPHLFSAVSVSIPKGYQVPVSSKADTVHRTNYSMGKSLTQALHSSSAAGAQAHMHPSKAVYAVKLYEGCEINV
ncbi:uncharacterized protein si:ch73-103b9.2 [Micropterus salmoides]|uniref:uncharacterized protein si:ch73-103b9.2 n=1 Tax=Micropterus salmoides TaxID=27706 RepID=UPI0018EB8531|nr:uncharacterized protein si:ch73-103b9.2 [Micropterus salmoides]